MKFNSKIDAIKYLREQSTPKLVKNPETGVIEVGRPFGLKDAKDFVEACMEIRQLVYFSELAPGRRFAWDGYHGRKTGRKVLLGSLAPVLDNRMVFLREDNNSLDYFPNDLLVHPLD